MTTQSSRQMIGQSLDYFNGIRKIWDNLTAPAVTITGESRRRASTLATLTLVFIPLAALAVFITPIVNLLRGDGFTAPNAAAMVGLVVAIAAYVVSRTQYYELGSYLIVSVPMIAVTGVALSSTNPVSQVALFYLVLSVILSSLLLDASITLVTGIITAALVTLLQVARPADTGVQWSIMAFVVVATGVMALVGRVRGQYVKALEITQDQLKHRIIEVDQARAQAERSDQVKSAFLASMSHELRTPMNAVINFTQFVVDGDTGPVNDEQKELLMEVIGSASHLLNLINDVLDMSKIEAGSLNLFVEDGVNLNTLLNSVVATGRGLLKDKNIQLQTSIEDDLPTIRGDRQRIVQILLNIVSNACKFTEEGEIKVAARRQGEELLITVKDTGPGIAKEDQASVFEAFKQTKTGLRQGGGTGLGMPIAKSLAEAHGGRMWLESEQGKGATFFVAMPIKSQQLELSLA